MSNVFYLVRYPKSELSSSEELRLFDKFPKWVKDYNSMDYYKNYCHYEIPKEGISKWFSYDSFGDRSLGTKLDKNTHPEVTFDNSPFMITI